MRVVKSWHQMAPAQKKNTLIYGITSQNSGCPLGDSDLRRGHEGGSGGCNVLFIFTFFFRESVQAGVGVGWGGRGKQRG